MFMVLFRATLVLLALLSLAVLGHAEPRRFTMFGGQLVRPTTLAGAASVELGGGGALYATPRFYWGGGGGTVFQLGTPTAGRDLELRHGELMVGYDVVQRPRLRVSAMALAGLAMTKQHSGVFAMSEARVAVRRPVTKWFMLGAHAGYRRAIAADLPMMDDADVSGAIAGLELYFTK